MKKTQKHIIIKRKGLTEYYDEKKVYASIYSASINAEHSEKKAETIALDIMNKVNAYVRLQAKSKKRVLSSDIRKLIISLIKNKDVAILYKHHLDIC